MRMAFDRLRSWVSGGHGVKGRSRDDWNQQYSTGQWDFLGSMDEMSRYWVGTGYCSRIPDPSVLDVGCGTGLFEEKLRLLPYSSYLGVDFSIDGLKAARKRMPASCRLVCADMTTFEASAKFDIITFMDLEWPPLSVSVMRRYAGMLRPGGKILLSLFDGRNKKASVMVWEEVKRNFRVEDMTRVENIPSDKQWTVAWISGEV